MYEKNIVSCKDRTHKLAIKRSPYLNCASETCDSVRYKACTLAEFITKYTVSRLL